MATRGVREVDEVVYVHRPVGEGGAPLPDFSSVLPASAAGGFFHAQYCATVTSTTLRGELAAATRGAGLHAAGVGDAVRLSRGVRALTLALLPAREGLPLAALPGHRRRCVYAGLLAHAPDNSFTSLECTLSAAYRYNPAPTSNSSLRTSLWIMRNGRSAGRTGLLNLAAAHNKTNLVAASDTVQQLTFCLTTAMEGVFCVSLSTGVRVPTFNPWIGSHAATRSRALPPCVDSLGEHLAVLFTNRCHAHLIVCKTVWAGKQVASKPSRARRAAAALNDALTALTFCPFYIRGWEALLECLDRLLGKVGTQLSSDAAVRGAALAAPLRRLRRRAVHTALQWAARISRGDLPDSAPLRLKDSDLAIAVSGLTSRLEEEADEVVRAAAVRTLRIEAAPSVAAQLLTVEAFTQPGSWLDSHLPPNTRIAHTTAFHLPYEQCDGCSGCTCTDPLMGLRDFLGASPAAVLKGAYMQVRGAP